MDNAKNYKGNEIGKQYGRWTVISKAESRKGRAYWLCECSCDKHTQKEIAGTELRRGKSLSCGCLQKEKLIERNKNNTKDITGQKFGNLIAIKPTSQRKNETVVWECNCSCGTQGFLADIHSLKQGYIKSCGCLKNKNIANQKQQYGKLTAIEPLDKKVRGNILWKCRCECGRKVEVISYDFTSEHVKSCGFCFMKSRGEMKISKILDEYNIPYQKEYTFKDCINPITNKKLRFDFFVDNEYLIEYDGKQHYIQDNGYGKDLKDIQYRDDIKNKYCKKNNIPLIRIPYSDYEFFTIEDLLLNSKYRI